MYKLYLTTLFVIINLISYGQMTFQTGYGQFNEDKGQVIIPTIDGRYCIIGSTGADITDSSDIAVYFLNMNGDLTFSYRIGLAGDDYPTDAIETNDGGFIIVGKTYSSPIDTANSDVFAVKIDNQTASVLWANVYGGSGNDEANSIIATPEGRFLITGNTDSYGSAVQSAMVLKIDQNGDPIWCNVSRIDSLNHFNSSDITSDNNYILAGYAGHAGDFDHYTAKMDSSGAMLWGKKSGTSDNEISNDIKTTSDNGFIIAGSTSSNISGDTDQTIVKMDSAGAVTWTFRYGTLKHDELNSIIETVASNYIACGTTDVDTTGGITNQMVIEQISSSGSLIWSNTYGTSIETSEGLCVVKGLDGGYAASGLDMSSDPAGDCFLSKTDDNGVSGCNEFILPLISNPVTLVDASNPVPQLINIGTAPVFMAYTTFTDQFTQNCFFDNIHENIKASLVKLYPNPAGNNIQIETALSNCTIVITNAMGQIVYYNNLNDFKSSIDITSFSSGLYFVAVKSESTVFTNKFVKQ